MTSLGHDLIPGFGDMPRSNELSSSCNLLDEVTAGVKSQQMLSQPTQCSGSSYHILPICMKGWLASDCELFHRAMCSSLSSSNHALLRKHLFVEKLAVALLGTDHVTLKSFYTLSR